MRRMTLGAGCGYRGSDPQRSVHVPGEALAQHLPRGRHLHPALPRGQPRDPLHCGPGPGRQVAGGQAMLHRPRKTWGGGKTIKSNRPSKFVAVNLNPKSVYDLPIAMTCDMESHIILSQVGCQWLASEMDQADYLMEKTYFWLLPHLW